MHCEHCGSVASAGARFCASCGKPLGQAPAGRERSPARRRLGRLAGRTRLERLLTAGTLAAAMIVVAAFVVLDPADEEDPQSAFTAAADPQCVAAKREIIRVQSAGAGEPALEPQAMVAMVAAAVGRWRRGLRGLRAPPEATAAKVGLDGALGRLSRTLGLLRRATRNGDDSKVAAGAQAVNQAAAGVDAASAALGLERCAAISLTGSAS